MISPTVGRIVLYRENASSEERAAIVTFVHNERLINICMFNANGVPIPMTSVLLLQPEDLPPGNQAMRCNWMPYQLGQAAKTEAAEAAACVVPDSPSTGEPESGPTAP